MGFYVKAINNPEPAEWFIYLVGVDEDGAEHEWEYINSYDSEIEAHRIKKTFESLDLVDLVDWVQTTR